PRTGQLGRGRGIGRRLATARRRSRRPARWSSTRRSAGGLGGLPRRCGPPGLLRDRRGGWGGNRGRKRAAGGGGAGGPAVRGGGRGRGASPPRRRGGAGGGLSCGRGRWVFGVEGRGGRGRG